MGLVSQTMPYVAAIGTSGLVRLPTHAICFVVQGKSEAGQKVLVDCEVQQLLGDQCV